MWTLGVLAALSALVVWCFAEGGPDAHIAGMLLLIFMASGLVGVLLGFLFAVPRSSDENPAAPSGRLLSTNTNLSKVSDWLTTMLIGVGLTQLHAIDDYLTRFRDFLTQAVEAVGVTGPPAAWIPYAGPLVLVSAACAGFILMYMHMRLNLVRLLHDTEEYLQGTAKSVVQDLARSVRSPAAGVAQSNQVSVGDALNVMLDALYEPDGYKRVIAARHNLETTPVANDGEFWFYLAAAYGQQWKATEDADEKAQAKANVLDTAQRAIRRDPKFRDRLWSISDPSGTDGDLAGFHDDPDFKALVGRA